MEEIINIKADQSAFPIKAILQNSLITKSKNGEPLAMKSSSEDAFDAFSDLGGQDWQPAITVINNNGNAENGIYLFNCYDKEKSEEFVKDFTLVDGEIELTYPVFTEAIYQELVGVPSRINSRTVASNIVSNSPSIALVEIFPTCDIRGVNGVVPIDDIGGCSGGGGTGNNSIKLYTINIKDKKESRWERADIHHSVVSGAFLESNTSYADVVQHNPSGKEVAKIRNRHLNETRTVNATIVSPRNGSGFIEYLIFEHDNFPAPVKTTIILGSNGTTFSMGYRSWNKDYDHQLLRLSSNISGIPSIFNYFESKNEIEYRIR